MKRLRGFLAVPFVIVATLLLWVAELLVPGTVTNYAISYLEKLDEHHNGKIAEAFAETFANYPVPGGKTDA